MALSTSNSPELNQEIVQKVLLKPLEAASTFLASGPRIVNSSNPVRFPKLGKLVEEGTTTPDEPDWIGENEEITRKDVDFGELELMPSTMKSVKVITKFSNELARQSVVSLSDAIQQRVVQDVATKLDKQFYGASGDGVTTPKGLLAQAGTQSIAYDTGDELLDVLTDAWGLCLAANVNVSGLRWVMTPQAFTSMRKIKEGSNSYRPILAPDVTADAAFRLLGTPITVTPNLPVTAGVDDDPDTAPVMLVDFSQVVVVRDLNASVTILRERYSEFDQQALRIVSRFDVGLANPEAVVKVTGVPHS